MSKAQIEANTIQNRSGKKQTDKQRILEYVKQFQSTRHDLERELNIKPETVTGRTSDLTKEGLIYVVKEVEYEGYNHSVYGYEKDPAMQKDRRYIIRERNYIKALRKLNDFKDLLKRDNINIDTIVI